MPYTVSHKQQKLMAQDAASATPDEKAAPETIKLSHPWFAGTTLTWCPDTGVRRWTNPAKGLDCSFRDADLELSEQDLYFCFAALSTERELPDEFVRDVLTSRIPPGTAFFHRGEKVKVKLTSWLYADVFNVLGGHGREEDKMPHCHPMTGKEVCGYPDSVHLSLEIKERSIRFAYDR